MIIRIFIGLALIVFAAGFIWFAGNVIWLGTKEFFKHYSNGIAAKTNKSKVSKKK
jgi:short-subunit dehydrogenase